MRATSDCESILPGAGPHSGPSSPAVIKAQTRQIAIYIQTVIEPSIADFCFNTTSAGVLPDFPSQTLFATSNSSANSGGAQSATEGVLQVMHTHVLQTDGAAKSLPGTVVDLPDRVVAMVLST